MLPSSSIRARPPARPSKARSKTRRIPKALTSVRWSTYVFDFSVWELVVIGGVALVVIGPERLPRVVRTAGHLLGRFQRYVAEVKADINREIELAELKKLQTTVQDAAREVEQSMKEGMNEAERQVREVEGGFRSAGDELRK